MPLSAPVTMGTPVANCLKPSCKGVVILYQREIGMEWARGWCDGCAEEYEIAFQAVLKAVP